MSERIKSGPFKGLLKNHYRSILADPAWQFTVRSDKGKGRSPEQHYDCLSLDEIKELPVADLCARDCALFMWTIDTHVDQAREVMRAWGFEYKTVGFYWVKTNKDGVTPFTGMGYWTRACPEQCLTSLDPLGFQESHQCHLATTGSPKRMARDVPRLIVSPRREHSRKPDEAHERIERLVGGPYLELFARRERPGWTAWGLETKKFNKPIRLPADIEALIGGSRVRADKILDLIG